MNIRSIGLAVITVAALAPTISSASVESSSLQACASAFATSIAAPGASAPSFKLSYSAAGGSGSLVQFYSHAYTFDLQARDPKTGIAVARAKCSTDRNGVVALSPIGLEEKAETLASR
jgi:hypothetical protein